MAKTLLDGVNEVLKRVQIVKSTDLLTSLTSSGKQVFIDLTVQCWNEAVDQLYAVANQPKPYQMKTDSIILVENIKDYGLADDLITLHWPLHDETNGQFIHEYPGGWREMHRHQSQPENYTGTPSYGAIHPENGKLYIDRIPTEDDANKTYYYDYNRDLELTEATDQFPFDNVVFRAMVPVVAELYRLYKENKYVEGVAKLNYGRAARLMTKTPARTSWLSRVGGANTSDPLNAD